MKKRWILPVILILILVLALSDLLLPAREAVRAKTKSINRTLIEPMVDKVRYPILMALYDYRDLRKGTPGSGAIEDIEAYWQANGYPEDISYVRQVEPNYDEEGNIINTYCEIGIVDADEARKQEILEQVAPHCLVTFRNCSYTRSQVREAYEKLVHLEDEQIANVWLTVNDDTVVVLLKEDACKLKYEFLLRWRYGLGGMVDIRKEKSSSGQMVELYNETPQQFLSLVNRGWLMDFSLIRRLFWWLPIVMTMTAAMWLVSGTGILIRRRVIQYRRKGILVNTESVAEFMPGVAQENETAAIGHKQLITAIMQHTETPGEDMFDRIMDQIEEKERETHEKDR